MANKTHTSFAYIPHHHLSLLHFRAGIQIIFVRMPITTRGMRESVYVNNYCCSSLRWLLQSAIWI